MSNCLGQFGLGKLCEIPAVMKASPTWTAESDRWWAAVNHCDLPGVQPPGPVTISPAQTPSAPTNPLCDLGQHAAGLPVTDPQFQTYFGTPARVQAYVNQCGPISLPGTTLLPSPAPTPSPVVIPNPNPPIVPISGANPPGGPTCIGANYTVNAQGECVYPAGGPSGGYSPPLTLAVPNPQPAWTPAVANCPDGSQPNLDGSCPVVMQQTPPSTLSVIEGYLMNPWVLGGGAVLIYLATRKKSRVRRKV